MCTFYSQIAGVHIENAFIIERASIFIKREKTNRIHSIHFLSLHFTLLENNEGNDDDERTKTHDSQMDK